MPTVRDSSLLEALTVPELQERRRQLLDKAKENGGKGTLTDEELIAWIDCTHQLRKKNAGPPKAKRAPASKEPVTSADL